MAKFIVAKANLAGYTINMTKLQKLLFIVYGVALVVNNETIINDECPHAWPLGPVFPRTRNVLMGVRLDLVNLDDPDLSQIKNDSDTIRLVDFVLNFFGNWTATMLVEWTHRDGSPWKSTTDLPRFNWNDVILDDYIRGYFSSILQPVNQG